MSEVVLVNAMHGNYLHALTEYCKVRGNPRSNVVEEEWHLIEVLSAAIVYKHELLRLDRAREANELDAIVNTLAMMLRLFRRNR